MSATAAEYNAQVIDEFRGDEGRVGGIWEGTPLLLLHHTGARSGASRVNPVGYLADESRCVIFASNGGGRATPPGTTTSRQSRTPESRWGARRSTSWPGRQPARSASGSSEGGPSASRTSPSTR